MDTSNLDQEEKFKQLLERARKGVLKYLDEKGGELSLDELHEYSLKTFFIQHQRFSQLMESLVESHFVYFDWTEQKATITPAGKEYWKKG